MDNSVIRYLAVGGTENEEEDEEGEAQTAKHLVNEEEDEKGETQAAEHMANSAALNAWQSAPLPNSNLEGHNWHLGG